MRKSRKFKNYILDANLQLRFAGYVATMLLCFSCVTALYAQHSMHEIIDVLTVTPGLLESAVVDLREVISGFFGGFFLLLAVFLFGTSGFIIWQTHRIAGAKYAIIRSLKFANEDPKKARPVTLRKGDFLTDIADEVNVLFSKIE